MTVRYFDSQGRQLSYEELQSLNISTPVMEHIIASVLERSKPDLYVETASSYEGQIDKMTLV